MMDMLATMALRVVLKVLCHPFGIQSVGFPQHRVCTT